jgi:hypothetical protein
MTALKKMMQIFSVRSFIHVCSQIGEWLLFFSELLLRKCVLYVRACELFSLADDVASIKN